MSVFLRFFDPIFSSLGPSNPPLFVGGGRGQSCLQWRKISALDSDGKDPKPLAQSRHGALSNCQICSCRLPELASLGWCHVRLFAREPVKTIPRCRGMSGDPFRASFGKFGGR